MEENYGVYFGNRPVGKVQVTRQGLYYHFLCRCELTGDVMCRLWVTCADKRESLGLVVPVDGGFGLKVKLVVTMPGVDRAVAEKIAERGHFICPYSNATKGNIEVTTEIA